jgi:pimeloyl-ACP methyl ester carboxylesterase
MAQMTSARDRVRLQRSRAIRGVIAIIAASSLAGCSGVLSGSAGPDGSNYKGISIASLRPHRGGALDAYYGQKPVWTPCHVHFQCTTIKAPVNWQKITGQSISLALIKHPATGTPTGDLLVNPGGPGGSGVDFVEEGVDGVVDRAVAAHYDVIGFDPRGVGASAPVTCFDNKDQDTYLYGVNTAAIGTTKWIANEEKKARTLAAACDKNTGPVLGHIDTVSAAEDMDLIRSALGDTRLNYLGYSYGTFLGTIYAGLFPQSVGKMVLDGADDPWGLDYQPTPDDVPAGDYAVDPADDSTVAQAVGFEDALVDYLESCQTNVSATVGLLRCPFDSTLANAKRRVEGFLAGADKHPLVAKDGRVLDAASLATAIDDSLYDPDDWSKLTEMFAQVEDGDPTIAFQFADDYNDRNLNGTYDNNGDLAHLAIGCLEEGPSVDIPFDRREATELKKVAPILGIYDAYGDLVCSGWKYGPSPFPNPPSAKGTGPILVLGTTGDPATPYASARDLADQLDGGHLITLHGQGHTAYNRGDLCIDTTVDAYLLHGTVPKKDPECR